MVYLWYIESEYGKQITGVMNLKKSNHSTTMLLGSWQSWSQVRRPNMDIEWTDKQRLAVIYKITTEGLNDYSEGPYTIHVIKQIVRESSDFLNANVVTIEEYMKQPRGSLARWLENNVTERS